MGFGLLFFGYAASYMMSFNSFGFIFRLTGTAVMLSGLARLCAFEKRFFYAKLSCILMAVAASCESVISVLLDYSGGLYGLVREDVKNIFFTVFICISVVFHVFIYRAIYKLSCDVGLDKISKQTIKFAVFAAMEILLVALSVVTWFVSHKVSEYFTAASIIYPLIIFILNLTLFYSCYKNICEEGDEDAPRKPSSIPFLNRLFEASEKRELEIYEKTKAYAENRIRQDNEKKKNKKKNKSRR
ncbi:MAG: hypothetical protein IKT56_03585 [Clostridia bacterium]|nr:hypothetical protein [Clostridia bacterium]